MVPSELKARWRETLRDARRALTPSEREAAARAATEALLASAAWKHARVVGLYAAYGAELGTAALRDAAHAEGKIVALPKVGAAGTTLRRVGASTPLVRSALGVPEPSEECLPLAVGEPDLIVVPGLGFDRHGGRLGHGGGHYDRLLATLPRTCRRIGFAYDQQVVSALPTEAHDLPMHALVTPSGWSECGS
jgi:5-formyltetrahydrofolate cyclo-ligase